MSVQYTGKYSVHRGLSLSTPEDTGTVGDTMSTVGDIMSTVGDIMSTVGDIMSTLGMFSTPGFPYKFNCFPSNLPPHLS